MATIFLLEGITTSWWYALSELFICHWNEFVSYYYLRIRYTSLKYLPNLQISKKGCHHQNKREKRDEKKKSIFYGWKIYSSFHLYIHCLLYNYIICFVRHFVINCCKLLVRFGFVHFTGPATPWRNIWIGRNWIYESSVC